MSIPKEPRQLMINLMYLVLTALLALNVSSEILNAFKIIRASIVKSNENITTRNGGMLEKFANAAVDKEIEDPKKRARFAAAQTIAQGLASYSDSVEKVIIGYKDAIIKGSDGYKAGTTELKAPENLDAATRLMIEQPNPKGKEFFDMLQKFKRDLSSMVPVVVDGELKQNFEFRGDLDSTLPITFKPGETASKWSFENFNMTPTIGALTLCDKYINDVRNAQTAINDELWWAASQEKRVKKTDNTSNIIIPDPVDGAKVFDKYKLMVSSPNSYLLPGEKYTAEAMIGTYNPVNNASITVNGRVYPMVEGKVKFEAIAGAAGENSLTIGGSYFDPNYKTQRSLDQIKTSFYVGQPAASIELDKMNVFYNDLANPITIAASGVPLSSISLNPVGVALTNVSPGHYTVAPTLGKEGTATIGMSARRADGSIQDFGTKTYRVKNVPNPVIKFAEKTTGGVRADIARIQFGPIPVLENFVYDYRFIMKEFTLTHVPKKGTATETLVRGEGFAANAEALDVMKRVKAGDLIIFEGIKVQGQGSTKIRTLPNTSFKAF
jgi:gliding motility-associated protein GldM